MTKGICIQHWMNFFIVRPVLFIPFNSRAPMEFYTFLCQCSKNHVRKFKQVRVVFLTLVMPQKYVVIDKSLKHVLLFFDLCFKIQVVLSFSIYILDFTMYLDITLYLGAFCAVCLLLAQYCSLIRNQSYKSAGDALRYVEQTRVFRKKNKTPTF